MKKDVTKIVEYGVALFQGSDQLQTPVKTSFKHHIP